MANVTTRPFGQLPTGEQVSAFRLEGAGGAYTEVLDYGATWRTTLVPGKNGLTDVCLSFDALQGYIDDGASIGAIVGRYANRVKGAAFTLNGAEYTLDKNNGENSIHGGFNRYSKRMWDYTIIENGVSFRTVSKDGDQGYPGNLDLTVAYTMDDNNTVVIDYTARADADTYINLTNHAYFNLAGAQSGAKGAMNERLTIHGGQVTEVDDGCVTTGQIRQVEGTAYDFRAPHTIGDRVDTDDPQMNITAGYDANYIIDGEGLREAAILESPDSGVSMRLFMTNPGVQLYSGNHLKAPFERRGAVCLEPQHYPNSIHHPHFPTTLLKAGEAYRQRAEYRFGIK